MQMEWESILKTVTNLTIDSDASLTGWGACCHFQTTGDPWLEEGARMHINCLELLAATLAVKSFAKDKSRVSILLRIDNTTAVAYINHLGDTISWDLINLTKNLWMWCLESNIHITVQHLPGSLNTIADPELWTQTDRTDWKLNLIIFHKINYLWGPLEVDLLASSLSTQCQHYFSWRGGQDPISGSDTAGPHCSGSPSVEVTTKVSNSVTNVHRLLPG